MSERDPATKGYKPSGNQVLTEGYQPKGSSEIPAVVPDLISGVTPPTESVSSSPQQSKSNAGGE
jgi:hypothetical protein